MTVGPSQPGLACAATPTGLSTTMMSASSCTTRRPGTTWGGGSSEVSGSGSSTSSVAPGKAVDAKDDSEPLAVEPLTASAYDDPRQIATGFLRAQMSAHDDYQAARTFLTGDASQLGKQALAAFTVLAYSFVMTLLIGWIIQKTMGFRVKNEDEIAGIDTAIHGEAGYVLAD